MSRAVRLAPIVVAVIALAVYVRTLLPGMAFDDWGEMQTVPHVLGVPHPTGYPTYVLAAWLFELLPLGSIAFRANLFSAVCLALALATATSIGMRLGVRPWIAAVAALADGGDRHRLGVRDGCRGQPAPPPPGRADPGPVARLGGRAAPAGPRARRAARRPLVREPPAHDPRRAVRGRLRGLDRPVDAPRAPAVAAGARRDRAPGPRGVPLPADRRLARPAARLQRPRHVGRLPVPRHRRAVPRPVRRAPVGRRSDGVPPVAPPARGGDRRRCRRAGGPAGGGRRRPPGPAARGRRRDAGRDRRHRRVRLGELPAPRALPAGAVPGRGHPRRGRARRRGLGDRGRRGPGTAPGRGAARSSSPVPRSPS